MGDSKFQGKWKITEMDAWDLKYIDLDKYDFSNPMSFLNETKTFSELQNVIKRMIDECNPTILFCKDILKCYTNDTLEWILAYLHINNVDLLKSSIMTLTNIWNSHISHPYSYQIKFDT